MFCQNATSNLFCVNYKFYRSLNFHPTYAIIRTFFAVILQLLTAKMFLANQNAMGTLSSECVTRLVPNCADGLVVRWVVAIDSTRVRFPVGALLLFCRIGHRKISIFIILIQLISRSWGFGVLGRSEEHTSELQSPS